MFKSQEEIEKLKLENNKSLWPTRYFFLKVFNGIRPKSLNLILAPSGIGKTTLSAGMVADCLNANSGLKTGVVLTEETVAEFYESLYLYSDELKAKNNLAIVSQKEIYEHIDTIPKFFMFLKLFVQDNNVGIIFIDNITTLGAYISSPVSKQNNFARELNQYLSEENLSCVIFGHPDPKITGRMLTHEDIRYGKNLPLEATHCWTMNPLYIGDKFVVLMKNTKHRGSEKPKQIYYGLQYKNKRYESDVPLNYRDIEDQWKKRNKV